MISKGICELNVSEASIVAYYLGVKKIPCCINSPLRDDKHPSLGLYSPDGTKVNWIDFGTKDGGRYYTLLSKIWNISIVEVFKRIKKEICNNTDVSIRSHIVSVKNYSAASNSSIEIKVRDWTKDDIEYWGSYGITVDWLKYCEVYPISHKIIIKDNHRYVFKADKYAYAYVEHKDKKTTIKVYQPFNTKGFKWSNKHDRSVISLWTKIPKYGDKVCICSSLKDALCLWINAGIPSVAIQGEGYKMSKTAISELKRRYNAVFVMLDNDEAGLKDALILSESTGFTNVVLPSFSEGKDISDLYKAKGKEEFLNIILSLFN